MCKAFHPIWGTLKPLDKLKLPTTTPGIKPKPLIGPFSISSLYQRMNSTGGNDTIDQWDAQNRAQMKETESKSELLY